MEANSDNPFPLGWANQQCGGERAAAKQEFVWWTKRIVAYLNYLALGWAMSINFICKRGGAKVKS